MEFLPNHISNKQRELFLDLLSNWNKTAIVLGDLSEVELLNAIYVEATTQRRMFFIERLKGRYNKLRSKRENEEILKLINKFR